MVLSQHPSMERAPTLVRSLVSLISRHAFIYDFDALVPCTLDTPISINVGGKEVRISPATFNLGPVSQGSDRCLAGAGADPTMTGGELVDRFPS